MPFVLPDYSSAQTAVVLSLASLTYIIITRLLLHPLSSYPGPRLAALSNLYAFYYEIIRNGLFVEHLQYLHSVYGPVVRIRPNELHFSNPQAFFAIYPPHTGFTKDKAFYAGFDVGDTVFSYLNADEHKVRRDILNPLFSRRAIIKFERSIQDKIDLLLERLREYGDKPVNFRFAFRSLTMDIITTYAYGYSFGGLDAPGFDHPINASIDGAVRAMATSRYVPPLRLLQNVPPDLMAKLDTRLAGYAFMRNSLSVNIDKHLANPAALRKEEHETIYHHLLPESVDPSLWPSKKSLIGEAQNLLLAGTDTTSNALTFGLYHLLLDENVHVRKRLIEELMNAWPEMNSPFSYEQAEKLPYLTAVVKESLRISVGVLVQLPRLVTVPRDIDGVHVPPGVVVSASAWFVIMNPDVFPQPEKFIPERWLQSNVAELDKHLVVFSRGPRSCLGMNLAWCEMYMTLAHLWRKFEVEMHNTSAENMKVRAYMLPSWCGEGLRAVVKEREN